MDLPIANDCESHGSGFDRLKDGRDSLQLRQGAGGACGDAAVDQERLAGDVAAGFGGEEDYGGAEVVGLAGALYRDSVG